MLGEGIQIGRSKSASIQPFILRINRDPEYPNIVHCIELFTTQGYIKITNIKEMAIQNPDSLVFNIKNFNV